MELILETHGQTVERPHRFLVLDVVFINGFGVGDGGIEEDLMEATELCSLQRL